MEPQPGQVEHGLSRDASFFIKIQPVLAIALCIGALAWAADLYRALGLVLYTGQFLLGTLALALPLTFLRYRFHERADRGIVPWYDKVAAVLGFVGCAYGIVEYPRLSEELTVRPIAGMTIAVLLVLLCIEALRRTTGMVLVVVVAVFLAYGLFGHYAPGVFEARPISAERLIYYLAWDAGALLGPPMRIATSIVVAFVFFGFVLQRTGGSDFFTDASMALMGRYRGGSAKIAITASALFGSVSGSAVANVVTTGVITIPMMKRGGYKPHVAGAVEAVASTGGQLMPPIMGASAFLMASILERPYSDIVTAALIPAILYYIALFIQVDLEAGKSGIRGMERSEIPNAAAIWQSGWIFPLPFVALIGCLFWLMMPPDKAAIWATIVLICCGILIGYRGRRIGIADLLSASRETGFAILDLLMITAAAGFIIGVLNITGLGFGLTVALVGLAGGNLFLLLLITAGTCIVLGLGMPTLGVYILLATLVAPALIELGVSEMAAHLFVLYFGLLSFITPPVAIAAFAAANLANSDPIQTSIAAVRFGWIAYVIPFLFVMSPSLLMDGSVLSIGLALSTAIGGVWLISASAVGYLFEPLNVIERAMLICAGAMLLVPADAFESGLIVDAAGFALGTVLVARSWLITRKLRTS